MGVNEMPTGNVRPFVPCFIAGSTVCAFVATFSFIDRARDAGMAPVRLQLQLGYVSLLMVVVLSVSWLVYAEHVSSPLGFGLEVFLRE